MSGRMWEAVKAKTRKDRVAETEGKRTEGRSKKEAKKEGTEEEKEKPKEGEKYGSMKGSRRMGNLGRRRRSSKVGGRSKKAGTRKIS